MWRGEVDDRLFICVSNRSSASLDKGCGVIQCYVTALGTFLGTPQRPTESPRREFCGDGAVAAVSPVSGTLRYSILRYCVVKLFGNLTAVRQSPCGDDVLLLKDS